MQEIHRVPDKFTTRSRHVREPVANESWVEICRERVVNKSWTCGELVVNES
jgi:hypothetical protein